MGSSCEWCLFLDESIWEVYLIINMISIISISFIFYIFIEHLQYTKNCSWLWGYSSEQNKPSPSSVPQGKQMINK